MSQSETHARYDQSASVHRLRHAAGGPSTNEVESLRSEVARLQNALTEQMARYVSERDAERESTARELHDNFGQYLTVMELELATIGAGAKLNEHVRQRLQKLRKLTVEAQGGMANLAWQIRPASLQGVDLESATRFLAAEWSERTNLLFDLHFSLGTYKLPPAIETTLYRVLQEALTNVAKHANARQVGVILRANVGQVVLVVEDDGDGFVLDQDQKTAASLGLAGVRERLALVSGTLEIETLPGRGTTVLVSVPL